MSGRNGFLLLGGISSVGAGAVHFMAAGMHTEHATLARSMVVLAAIQCATGLAVLLSERRIVASAVLAVMDYTQLKSISDEEVRQAISAAVRSARRAWTRRPPWMATRIRRAHDAAPSRTPKIRPRARLPSWVSKGASVATLS